MSEAPQVDVTQARTFVSELVGNAEAVKTMKDEDVVKEFTRVSGAISKHGYARPAEPPKEYKLTLPEKSALQQGDVEGIVAYAKEQKLSAAEAQRLVDRLHADRLAQGEGLKTRMATREKEWLKAFEQDKEFGGEKLAASTKAAQAVIDEFGDEELRAVFKETGYHHNPAVRRFLTKLGIAMAEDRPNKGGGGGGDNKDPVKVLYGGT